MVTGALIRAQCRRASSVTTGPLVAGGLVALVGWAAASAWPAWQAMTLVNWMVQVFVICAGVCVAVAITGDPLIELHESTPTPFRIVQIIRAGIVTLSALIGAVVMFAPLHALRVWPHDQGWISLASPAGAALIVAAVAVVTAAFARTMSATTIAIVAAWVFLTMLWDPHVLPLSLRRGLPLAAAVPLLVIAWRRMGDAERNIAKVATV